MIFPYGPLSEDYAPHIAMFCDDCGIDWEWLGEDRIYVPPQMVECSFLRALVAFLVSFVRGLFYAVGLARYEAYTESVRGS